MPYSIKGKKIINRKTGKVRKFGSAKKAKNWARMNMDIKHGFIPTGGGKRRVKKRFSWD